MTWKVPIMAYYKKKIHPGSLLPMGCPNNDSNNMAVQRRNTDGQTDRRTDRRTFFLD